MYKALLAVFILHFQFIYFNVALAHECDRPSITESKQRKQNYYKWIADSIKLAQPDEEKQKQLREVYGDGDDAMILISTRQTVVTELPRSPPNHY